MRTALDTNVISELAKADCNVGVRKWVQDLDSKNLYLPAPCWAELQRGIRLLPMGQRRSSLSDSLDALVGDLGGVLAFSRAEAEVYAELTSQPDRPRPTVDAMIAAICRTHELSLATRNAKDFDGCGIDVVNPFTKT